MDIQEEESIQRADGIQQPPKEKKPGFGFWSTNFLGLLVMAVNIGVSLGVMYVYMVVKMVGDASLDILYLTQELLYDGAFLSYFTISTGLVCAGLILFIVFLKKDITIKDYLGFRKPTVRAVILSLVVYGAFIGIQTIINSFLPAAGESEGWMGSVYIPSPGWFYFLMVAFVLVGPAFEELLFRGFLMAGIKNSRLGSIGAVILTAVFWTVLHVQYGVYGLSSVMIMGIMFGIMRLKTRSIWIPFILHAVNNLIAGLQMGLI